VDAYPGKVFEAHVDSIQAGSGAAFSLLPPENATGYFIKVVQRVPVKIVFNEPPDLSAYHLGPGMSVVPTVNVSVYPAASLATTRRALPQASASADAAPPAAGTAPR
jgi:multidrug resistance efflux pump